MRFAFALKGIIGKGGRGPQVREALQKHRAVYFLAVGGAGALLSKRIRSVEVVAYEDLLALGSMAEARKHGKLRSEGKTYRVQDGDVLEILHSK